ncbi:alanine--tRNA ligase [Selenomonas sp. TAMA-11512]|uniref:alanine--tRNA ligase n=1 Tax=Selenomonas sp. TAMA-11512 TaxID=3095337 RepID=UPI0030D2F168
MSGNELREAYLRFFAEKKAHLRLASASLIPENDPTLLIIGAGMAPFKPFFTGKMKPPCTRITTSQRCVRTGDIENVGRTARHQTFFEMLGNFSFGDYFKQEAISWAWEFLTEVVELPKDKLWASVYPDDEEAIAIWLKQPGFAQDHIVKLEDNFWEIGEGPCGPDSEIYIDLGEERGCGKETCAVGCDCDRYLEIWNLVFTQYNRTGDGEYLPLEHKNIDTGCGLERLASVVQAKKTNFETDLLYPIIEYAAGIAGVAYGKDVETDISLKVIADHARSMAIMIMDGILPSNEGRGYVLRRILRRAIRHARLLGIQGKFLEGVVNSVISIFKDASDFGAIVQKEAYIKKVISQEEDRFHQTLSQGMELLNEEIKKLKDSKKTTLDGKAVFKLYDTFGFPWELTEEILEEEHFSLDKEGFEAAMKAQRERARAARGENQRVTVPDLSGIDTASLQQDSKATHAEIVAIWKEGILVDTLADGEEAGIILSVTPFYAEGGGQVGDAGHFTGEFGKVCIDNAKRLPDGTIYHLGYVEEGQLKVGESVSIQIDQEKKRSSARNHTATHLLQAALKKVVGDQVNQAGSLVTPERLRFDFSNFEPLTEEQLKSVEDMVNEEILKGTEVTIRQMKIDDAKAIGAMALFGEKYGDIVRVVSVGDFSVELCGGSHVRDVGLIGSLKIISETGVAAGVRRIEAITGRAALAYANKQEELVCSLARILKCQKEDIATHVTDLQTNLKDTQKKLAAFQASQAKDEVENLLSAADTINGVTFVGGKVTSEGVDDLRKMADLVIDKLSNGVVVLASAQDGKAILVAKAGKDALDKGIHAGNVVKAAAKAVNGGGGGRKDMAQAGGNDPDKIDEAIKAAKEEVQKQIG